MPINNVTTNTAVAATLYTMHQNVLREQIELHLLHDYVYIRYLTLRERIEVLENTRAIIEALIAGGDMGAVQANIAFLKSMLLWDGAIENIVNIVMHPCPQNRSTGSGVIVGSSGNLNSEGISLEDGVLYVCFKPFGSRGGIAKEQQGLFSFTNFQSDEEKRAQILECHPGMETDDPMCSNLQHPGLVAAENDSRLKQGINDYILGAISSAIQSCQNAHDVQEHPAALEVVPRETPVLVRLITDAINCNTEALIRFDELSAETVKGFLSHRISCDGQYKNRTIAYWLMHSNPLIIPPICSN